MCRNLFKTILRVETHYPQISVRSTTPSTSPTEGSSTCILVPAPTSGGLPVVTITTVGNSPERDKPKPLPPLPSHRYRYTLWHDLRTNEIRGDQLRNPRVRKGPPVKEQVFYDVKDEQGESIHHDLKGSQKRKLQRRMENWEKAIKVNLSYQDLGHEYQIDSLHSILKRLSSAEEIQLMDDNFQDLRAFNFPRCTTLNLSQNYIASFQKLPKCPKLKTLNLSDNAINSFSDLSNMRRYPELETLDLRRNPVCFEPAYRQRVFEALPQLLVLDGIPRLPSDSDEYTLEDESRCVLC